MSEISSGTMSPASPAARPGILKMIALSILFLVLVLVFSIAKIPESRVTALVQGQVQSALDPYDIYLTDRGRSLSFLTGIRYRLDHPALEMADQTRIELDDLEVRPKLMSLLTGRAGAKATLHQGNAEMTLDAAASRDKVNADIELKDIDLGRFGVLGFAGVKGAGLVSGKITLDGGVNDLASFNGLIDLKLKKIRLDEQSIMGFKLPEAVIGEGTLLIEIKNGKLVMKSVQLGRQSDDLSATLTGDLTLNRNLNASALNLRAVFSLSGKLKSALSMLEGLIAAAKQADGRYAYKMTGILGQPDVNPDPKQ